MESEVLEAAPESSQSCVGRFEGGSMLLLGAETTRPSLLTRIEADSRNGRPMLASCTVCWSAGASESLGWERSPLAQSVEHTRLWELRSTS